MLNLSYGKDSTACLGDHEAANRLTENGVQMVMERLEEMRNG